MSASTNLKFLAARRSDVDLEFATLSGNPDFTNIFAGMADLTALILVFDYVYRGYSSMAIFVRYWGNSAVGLPDINVQKFGPGGEKASVAERFARCVTGPWMLLLLLVGAVSGVVWVVGSIYTPWLQQYQVACNTSPHQDTLIGANAYALIFNFATSEGTANMQSYAKDYDTARSELCGDLVTSTSEQHNGKEHLFQSYQRSWGETQDTLALLSDCMDSSVAGHNFRDLTVIVDGKNYRYDVYVANLINLGVQVPAVFRLEVPFEVPVINSKPHFYKESKACMDPSHLDRYAISESMAFRCEQIPLCDAFRGCNATIDRDGLGARTHTSSCESEKMALMGITAVVLSVLVFIIWNVGRNLLLAGISRIAWRYLVPRGFNYLGNCDREGKLSADFRDKLQVHSLSHCSYTFVALLLHCCIM
jgi:hypothetical protein